MSDLVVIALALMLDIFVGEMPASIHPVVGMGKLLSLGKRKTPSMGDAAQFAFGFVLVLAVATLFGLGAYVALRYASQLNLALYVAVSAVLLKSCFSLRELAQAAGRVKTHLDAGESEGARLAVRSLVGRETDRLDCPQVVSAAVESVAENASDSFVAPLFYFLLFGVPGALVYRVVNTADAMIGYHGKFEFLGKAAARLDDALNFVPARLTGLLLVAASWVSRRNGRESWRTMWRDHGRTQSPNAGWPMSAMAGSLGVRLEKEGHYLLGDERGQLVPETIRASARLMYIAAGLWVAASIVAKGVQLVAVA